MNGQNKDDAQESVPINQAEVNQAIRILKGERMKYTVHLLMKNGIEYQFQSDQQPNVAFDDSTRTNILRYDTGGLGYNPVCAWDLVLICRCEKNPT